MRNTADFLDDLRAKLGVPSDGKLALRMAWKRQQVSRYRQLHNTFDDQTALRVAAELEIDPAYLMACMKAQLAKSPELRAIWERLALKVAACFLLGIGLVGHPATGEAAFNSNGIIAASYPALPGTIYTLCVKWLSWLLRGVLGASIALAATGCASLPGSAPERLILSATPWVECDRLAGTFGHFLDAAGCYRITGGECVMVIGLQPDNLPAQADTLAHERRHCREGDFHP